MGNVADAMRAASRKQQQSRQPRNSTTACLVTLLSGGGGSMAAAAAASRPSRASSLAAGVVPAFAARVSSSLASKRNHGDREVGSGRSSLVAVGRRTSSRGRSSNDRGVSTAVSMSVEDWKIQPRGLGLPGGAFSRAGRWPPAVGDRYDGPRPACGGSQSHRTVQDTRLSRSWVCVGWVWVGPTPTQPFFARILTPTHGKTSRNSYK